MKTQVRAVVRVEEDEKPLTEEREVLLSMWFPRKLTSKTRKY